jgi:tetratricopeptide (TPR) repeat protein
VFRRNLHIGIKAAVLLFFLSGCVTDKNNFLTRSFHNTTAHYNGYFWGNLSYEEGLDKLTKNHKDDYTSILPVFVYADDKEAQTIYPEMDRAIKKASTMIEKHTITNKQKREIPDAVKYIKYCYLLLAKARLYKNEYLTSIEALDYAAKEYRKTTVKYEAIMWEARAYNQIGSVSNAEELIDLLKSSKKTPKKLYPAVYATIADYYLRTGQYDGMAKWLKKAIEVEKSRSTKARYYYILGQLSQRDGKKREAFDFYTRVIHSHPPYDLEFEANINRALLFMGDDKENQKIKALLFKMLKPTINIDNRDQIYFALAKISVKEEDTTNAIKYLKKSVRSSTTNGRQKAMSFLDLGDISFYRADYIPAKKYYDSALISLPKNYIGRDSIVQKRDNLQKLVKYLDMIALEDSLLNLSKLSQADLDKYAAKVAANEKKADEQKKQQEAQAAEAQNSAQNSPVAVTGPPNSTSWYYYNASQIQMGINEFNQKWGNRVLEDNWRRSKKIAEVPQASNEPGKNNSADSTATAGTKTLAKKDSANAPKSKYDKSNYLKNIPRTDAQVKAANDSLVEAYYNAGGIYKEYLHNNGKAATDFEELLSRYPDNKYKVSVYYQLYRIYTETGNTGRADHYKNIILTQYPNSEYALLIANPEKYRQNLKANQDEMNKLYTATVESYEAARYLEVMHNCLLADSLYPKNPLTPKFAFLEAVATGYTQGLDAYKHALSRVIILYPKDSVKLLAQRTLDYLNKKPITQASDTGVKYTTESDTLYYWVALIDNKEANKINDFKIAVSTINSQTYSQDNLVIDDLLLNSNSQLLLIRKFKTAEAAKNYNGYMNSNSGPFKPLAPGSYQIFYISSKNFRTMFGHRKADEYVQFFKDKGL